MIRSRAAKKAAAAAVVVFLAANAFLSFNSSSYGSTTFDYDPTEISRRLEGMQQQQPRAGVRARVISSLRRQRGISPGDPGFQRLFLARLSDIQKNSETPTLRRITLRNLGKNRRIWMRQDKERQNQLEETHQLNMSNNEEVMKLVEPLTVCGRSTNVGKKSDLALLEYGRSAASENKCPGANSNKLLLLRGRQKYGRTGNNLIEFMHALQYAHDHDVTLGITWGSWVLQELMPMFMANHEDGEWRRHFEQSFCVKVFNNDEDFKDWDLVQLDGLTKLGEGRGELGMDKDYLLSKKMFIYISQAPLHEYIAYQSKSLQTLFRNINTGEGLTARGTPVGNMCKGIEAVFGGDMKDVIYSVIHLRGLEGEPGLKLMKRMSEKSGSHPTAALDMSPDYVKSILRPLGMLQHPIVLITDGQSFDSIRGLITDPEIGPMLRLAPQDASWIGSDITLGTMSNVFIGNPASSFSGFIAKSRLALGFGHSYLFRNVNEKGEWVSTCGDTCVLDRNVMGSMS